MSPLFKYVIRNIVDRPLISLLALGSMFIAAFTLSGMGAVGIALRQYMTNTGDPQVAVVMSKGAKDIDESSLKLPSMNEVTAAPEVKKLSLENGTAAQLRVVVGVTQRERENPNCVICKEITWIKGLDPIGIEVHNIKVTQGRLPAEGEDEVMVGRYLAERHPAAFAMGQTLQVGFGRNRFKVVGVFDSPGHEKGDIVTSRKTFLRTYRSTDPGWAYVETAGPAQAMVDRVTRDRSEISASSEPTYLRGQLVAFKEFYNWLTAVFVLVIAGTLMAAASTFIAILSRRTGELCTLRALGFSNVRVAGLVLAEIHIFAVVGAILGIAATLLLVSGRVVYGGFAIYFQTNVSNLNLLITLGVMEAIALAGALVPILKAIRINIRDGLRTE